MATFAEELVRQLKEAGVEEVMIDLQDENGGDVDENIEDIEDRDRM